MPLLSIGFGILLIIISIATYALDPAVQPVGVEPQTPVAFVPAVLGLLIMGCGVAALIKQKYRMHLMHGAVMLAALGVLYPLIRLIQFMFPINADSLTVTRNILVPVTCGLFLYFAIQSFITARKTRNASEPVNQDEPRPKSDDVA